MKLEVLIVVKQTGNSPVIKDGDHNAMVMVSDMPMGLRDKMLKLLVLLKVSEISEIKYVEQGGGTVLLLKKNWKYYTPDIITQPNIKELFDETIPLLVWHFSEHFSLSGRLGGTARCFDCGRSQEPSSDPQKCQNYKCSSHEKWLAIDPEYVATTAEEDPVAQRFSKMNEGIQNVIKIH